MGGRALVIQVERLGDLIQTTPLLMDLIASDHEAVDLLALEHTAPVVAGLPGLGRVHTLTADQVITLERALKGLDGTGGVAAPVAWETLRGLDLPTYDTVYDACQKRTACFIAGNVGARTIHGGFYGSAGERLLAGDFGTHLVAMFDARRWNRFNLVDFYRGMAGSRARPLGGRPFVEVDEDAGCATPEGPYVVCNPGASREDRRWEPERFAAVADTIHALGFEVVLAGGPADRAIADRVSLAMRRRPANVTGENGVGGMARLIADAELVVTNDTGASHLAAATGTPSVGIFAAGTARETGPWAAGHFAVSPAVGGLDEVDVMGVRAVLEHLLRGASAQNAGRLVRMTGGRLHRSEMLPPTADALGGVILHPLDGLETDEESVLARGLRHLLADQFLGAPFRHPPVRWPGHGASDALGRRFARLERETKALLAAAQHCEARVAAQPASFATEGPALDRELEGLRRVDAAAGPEGLLAAQLRWKLKLLAAREPLAIATAHRVEIEAAFERLHRVTAFLRGEVRAAAAV